MENFDEFIIIHSFISKLTGKSSSDPKIGWNNAKNTNANCNNKKLMGIFVRRCISDWACGGQWNRAYQFVRLLVDAFNAAHIELIAFFDGTLKENKKSHTERVEIRQKTISVLKHIRMIGTPPPKIWWIPPSGLRTCLRNALRSMNVIVVSISSLFVCGLFEAIWFKVIQSVAPFPSVSIQSEMLISSIFSRRQVQTVYDHTMEVIDYFHEYKLDGK